MPTDWSIISYIDSLKHTQSVKCFISSSFFVFFQLAPNPVQQWNKIIDQFDSYYWWAVAFSTNDSVCDFAILWLNTIDEWTTTTITKHKKNKRKGKVYTFGCTHNTQYSWHIPLNNAHWNVYAVNMVYSRKICTVFVVVVKIYIVREASKRCLKCSSKSCNFHCRAQISNYKPDRCKKYYLFCQSEQNLSYDKDSRKITS